MSAVHQKHAAVFDKIVDPFIQNLVVNLQYHSSENRQKHFHIQWRNLREDLHDVVIEQTLFVLFALCRPIHNKAL